MESDFVDSAEVECSIGCLAASATCVFFTMQNCVYKWDQIHSFPSSTSVVTLPFLPATICAWEYCVFAASNESVITCCFDVDPPTIAAAIPPTGVQLFPLITQSKFSFDGGAVALLSRQQVFLFRVGADNEKHPLNETHSLSASRVVDLSGVVGPNTSTDLLCFGATVLFVLFKNNHLVAFEFNEDQPANVLDGRIVFGGSRISTMLHDGRNGRLLLGCGDGSIKLLSSEKATLFQPLSQIVNLQSVIPPHPLVVDSEKFDVWNCGCCVLCMALVGEHVLIATPMAACFVHRASLSASVIVPWESVCAAASVSEAGLVLASFPFSKQVAFRRFISKFDAQQKADLVHSTKPLALKHTIPLEHMHGSTRVVGQAVTFGHPIRSSGYSSVPWSEQQRKKLATNSRTKKELPDVLSESKYDIKCEVCSSEVMSCTAALSKNSSTIHMGAICSAVFDATGSVLVTASSDSTLHMLKLPVPKFGGEGVCLKGHKTYSTTVDASLSLRSPLFVSGSTDGMLALWKPLKKETPVLSVNLSPNREIRGARFFYMDNLIVASSGSKVVIAKYLLDFGGGDLDRSRNLSKLTETLSLQTPAQNVTAVDCINYFLSSLVLWSGSNKQIGIYDVAVEEHVRVLDDAHTRSIHSLVMMANSRFAQVGTDTLHCVASAGLDSCVRLWDLRTKNSVRSFSSHVNNSLTTGLCFSPCGRFLVSGGEDRHAVIYDIASGATLAKLPVSDTVTSCRYHPTQPLLAVGTLNGAVRFFGPHSH